MLGGGIGMKYEIFLIGIGILIGHIITYERLKHRWKQNEEKSK